MIISYSYQKLNFYNNNLKRKGSIFKMKQLQIFNKLSSSIGKIGLKIKTYSPEILVTVGVAGTVISAVLACKATLKVSTIIEPSKKTIETIRNYASDDSIKVYSQQDANKDLTIVYIQTGLKIAKEYAPAIILGALSLTAIISSHNILRKRNFAIASAYAILDKGFKEYQNRVAERFGTEVERQIKYDIKTKDVTETVVDEDTGESKDIEKTVDVVNSKLKSPYSRFFDEVTTKYWDRNHSTNLFFLKTEQNYANDRLRARGFLFLNDVYDRLGIPLTKVGQVVGWVYNEENPVGDNYIDFGIQEFFEDYMQNGASHCKKAYLLDFNVDGNILNSAVLEK